MRVLAVCDGGGSLGVGHVMRCLALAEAAVAAGHDVVVAGRFEGSFLGRQLSAAPVEVVHLASTAADGGRDPVLEVFESLRPDLVHVDSYDLSGSLRGSCLLSNMEDGTFGRRAADVVVDPTLGAELSPRPQDGSTWLLRGSRYTPLRQRVIDAGGRRFPDIARGNIADDILGASPQAARSVLVVMGGTDPVGLAPGTVRMLARTGLALEVTAIAVGDSADRARDAAEGSRLTLKVLAPVDDLAVLMSDHDLVISAAGTSIWELCSIGVPMAVVWAVDNQREGYDRVVAAGAAIGLGGPGPGGPESGGPRLGQVELGGDEHGVDLLRRVLTDPRVRADLVLAGRRAVDGLGAWRVVRTWEQALAVRSLPAIPVAALVVRPATLQDARLLWLWRNDPVTLAWSRSSAEVPWDDHLDWLTASLTRTDRVLLVVDDPHGPVGTVRWDLRTQPGQERAGSREWEVSIAVAPQRRGQSLARPLLRAAEVDLSAGTDVTAYLAVVHVDNRASMRLFQTSGYVPDLPPDPRGFMRYRKTARVP